MTALNGSGRVCDRTSGQQITMDVNGVAAVTTAQELGFSWSNRDQVKADLEEYTSGNVIRRYFKRKIWRKLRRKSISALN